jgi:GT2 family glycosyltransferase
LVLLDDGCSDGTSTMVERLLPELTILHGKGDWWWGGALHQGYLWLLKKNVLHDSIILIMNDDSQICNNFLENGVSFLAHRRRTLLVAECYELATNTLLDRGVYVDWKKFTFTPVTSTAEVNCLTTRGLFLRMSDLEEIGGFYPKLIPHYLSDYEFTIRARRKGMELCTTPSVVLSVNSETTGLQSVSTETLSGLFQSLCSLRSANHLWSWTFFIIITCPVRWIPLNLARTYAHACRAFCATVMKYLSFRRR